MTWGRLQVARLRLYLRKSKAACRWSSSCCLARHFATEAKPIVPECVEFRLILQLRGRQAGGEGHSHWPQWRWHQTWRDFTWGTCPEVLKWPFVFETLCVVIVSQWELSLPFLPHPQNCSGLQRSEVPSGGCTHHCDSPLPPHGDGFVVGRFGCPCHLLKLQLWVSGCVLASAKSNSHWSLDDLLCPVEVSFYSFVFFSGGKK